MRPDLTAQKHTQTSIAVIIVNYNAAELVIAGVQSVLNRDHGGCKVDIHIVDNASPGKDADLLETAAKELNWPSHVTLYQETENHGFGRGNNIVLDLLAQDPNAPDYVFLLNPDAQLNNETLDILATFLDAHPQAAFAGSRAINPDAEQAVPAAFRYPSISSTIEAAVNFGPISKLFRRSKVALEAGIPTQQVDWVSGAGVMARRDIWASVGNFDPYYFLYFEEVDLMRACTKAGYEGWFVAEAEIVHLEGASTKVQSRTAHIRPRRPAYWYDSWQYYFVKNHGRVYALLTAFAWIASAALNHLIAKLRGQTPYAPRHFFKDFWNMAVRPIIGLPQKRY